VLLVAIMVVQGWNISDYPTLSDDEGTYLAQAWAVQEGRGLAHYTYWYDHPPLGWIQLAALTWIPATLSPESMTVGSMRATMLVISGISAILVYVLGRRLSLPRWAAGLGMVFFGLSPLSVVLQREIFLDNLAVMWTLLAFTLAASPSRHLWHHFGAGIAAATAVLTKETMLVILPALLVTMWRHSHRDTRKFALTGAITACTLIGFSYPLFALLKGELLPGSGHVSLWDGVKYQMTRPGSGFILDQGSGSYGVLQSWLYYDRILPLGGLAGALLLLATWRWSVTARALAGPALTVAILAALALRPNGYLPAMYVIQALPFLALVVAGGTASVAHGVLRRWRAEGEKRYVTGGRYARHRRRRLRRTALVRRRPHRRHPRRQRPLQGRLQVAEQRGGEPEGHPGTRRRRDVAGPGARRVPAGSRRHLVLQGRPRPGGDEDDAARLEGHRLRRRLADGTARRGRPAQRQGGHPAFETGRRLRHR
jgi:hypothetical protein